MTIKDYIIRDYIERNTEFLNDFLNGWKKNEYFRNRSYMREYYSKYRHGTLLGRVRLPISEGLYDMWFPDHCPGETVFYAVMFKEITPHSTEPNSETAYEWIPTIAVVCTHFEYGLPYLDSSIRDLMTLAEVVAEEAFKPIYYGEALAEVLDSNAEKLLMLIIPYANFKIENKTFSKAFRMFRPNIRDQLQKILWHEKPSIPPKRW